ncbi:MAG: tRNA lysidine(34) synthetase TilS [Saprospiraceae bacterium]
MLVAFKDYIQDTQLFSPTNKILLAVSGGLDSMVMAHLFKQAGFNFAIAHCNFQLRGEASDGDEKMVEKLAKDWEVPFHTIRFETIKESEKQHKSVELIGRELRYQWFGELLQMYDYQFVATAHHLNDSLETLLYNLAKGTGIRGLHGIPLKNGQVIRPLSYASRFDIERYANSENIVYREDASNESLEHNRNLIRHQVIPPLKKINPSLENTFAKTLKQLQETETLFLWAVAAHKKDILTEEEGLIKIAIAGLNKVPAKSTILYEIIKDYGFNTDHVDQIFRAIDNVGAQFYSKMYHILIERKSIIIKRKGRYTTVWRKIEMLPEKIDLPKGQLIATILKEKPKQLNLGKAITLLDLDKIKLPLIIRNWKDGDRFQPLGMNGKSKKITHYLRDNKVSLFEKSTVLVIESAGEIIWVMNYRADERFKVTAETTRVLQLHRVS